MLLAGFAHHQRDFKSDVRKSGCVVCLHLTLKGSICSCSQYSKHNQFFQILHELTSAVVPNYQATAITNNESDSRVKALSYKGTCNTSCTTKRAYTVENRIVKPKERVTNVLSENNTMYHLFDGFQPKCKC